MPQKDREFLLQQVFYSEFRVRRAAPCRTCAGISHAAWLMAPAVSYWGKRHRNSSSGQAPPCKYFRNSVYAYGWGVLFLWIPCIHLFLVFIFITKLALSATFNKAEARDSCSYYTVLRLSWPMSGLPDKATPFSTCHQPGPTWELVRRPWLKCLPFSLICISNPNTWHILISRSIGLAGPQPSPAHRWGWFITPSAGDIFG